MNVNLSIDKILSNFWELSNDVCICVYAHMCMLDDPCIFGRLDMSVMQSRYLAHVDNEM